MERKEPWNLGATDAARCAALLTLSGQTGDFVVAIAPPDATDDDGEPIYDNPYAAQGARSSRESAAWRLRGL